MPAILFSLFAADDLSDKLQKGLACEKGIITIHQFPDSEISVEVSSSVSNKDVYILTSLASPNEKIVTLIFVAETLKEFGAKSVNLIAPYLAYMRQDKRFNAGESITAKYFATLISHYFDFLLTIDPHLHRYHSLDEIYTIPSTVLHSDKPISQWINANIKKPLIIGPDKDSKQWAENIAKDCKAPLVMLEKVRKGDREIEMKLPPLDHYQDYTPVLVDDIISTAKTMIVAVNELKKLTSMPACCIGVHAVFVEDAYEKLLAMDVVAVVSCNTIKHVSNAIDISELIISYSRNKM